MTTGALARVIRRGSTHQQQDTENCDLCSDPVPTGHRHLLDTDRHELLCACQPCSLLFVRDAASEGHYRLIPQRRIRLAPVPTEPLGVPVGLAFFTRREDETAIAHYPSPAGATRWDVDHQAWHAVTDRCPPLHTLEPEVEALLVNTARGQRHHWIAPIDDCFRIVAIVRREWTGLSGGSRVWPAIDTFFAGLTEQR